MNLFNLVMKHILRILFTLFISFLLKSLSAQCSYTQVISVPDEGSTALSFLISNAVKNNLGSNNKLCEVELDFKHEGVGDLGISIISPAGQKLELVGAAGSIANTTDNTIWKIKFVQCSQTAAPDPGLNDIWDNTEIWGFGQVYTGSYYPYGGCLEDINIGTVNGTWTVLIEDADQLDEGIITSIKLTFCDDDLNCTVCSPPAVSPIASTIQLCRGTDFVPGDLKYNYTSANKDSINYRNTYAVFGKNKFSGILRDTSVTKFDTGSYKLCLLTYALADSLSLPKSMNLKTETLYNDALKSQGVCAQLNGCINLKVLNVSDTIILNREICKGESFTAYGKTFNKEGSFFVSSTAGQCDSIINIVVDEINLKGTITKSKPILTCVDNKITLTSNIVESQKIDYKWTTKNGFIEGAFNNKQVVVSAKGTYYLEVSHNNCTAIDSIKIDADVAIPTISLSGDSLNCSMLEANIILTTSSIVSSVTWKGPMNTKVGNNIKTSLPGVYTVKLIDDKNCEANASIEIFQNISKPTITLDIDSLTCIKDTMQIKLMDSTNIKALLWKGSNILSPNDLYNNFIEGGKYTLTLLGFNGCTDSVTIDLKDVRYTLDVNVKPDTINCLNTSALLIPISSDSFSMVQWLVPTGDTIFTRTLDTAIPGLYQVTVIDSNFCKGSANVIVKLDTIAPKVIVSNKTLTCTDSVQLFVDNYNPDLIYRWTGGGKIYQVDSPFVKVTGLYQVTASDKNNCASSAFFSVLPDQNLPNIVFIVDTLKCQATTAKITPKDTLGFDFKWNQNIVMLNSIDNPYGLVNSPGIYEVEVKNRLSNCKRRYTFEVQDLRISPIIDLAVDTIGCKADSTQISFTSNLPYQTLTWSFGSSTTSDEDPFVKTPGLYKVQVKDEAGCVFNDSIVVIKDLAIPDIVTKTNIVNCNPAGVDISAFVIDNVPTYSWFFKGNNIGNKAVQKVNVPGIYEVVVKNNRGCIDTASLTVGADTLRPKLNVAPFGYLNCKIKKLDLILNANEKIKSYIYNGPGIVNSMDNMISVNKSGTYTLTAIDTSFCKDSLKVIVTDSSRFIVVTDTSKNITCDSMGKVILSLDLPADSIIWAGPINVPLNSKSFTSNTKGLYTYKVVSKDKCVTDGTIDLIEDKTTLGISLLILDTITCKSPIADIGIELSDITKLRTVSWNGLTDKTLKIKVDKPKTYSGIVTGNNGCTTPFSIKVDEDVKLPSFTLKGDTIDCNNAKIDLELKSTLPLTTMWTSPNGKIFNGQKVKIDNPGLYQVSAFGANGCVKKDSILIVNNLTIPKINLPDTFLLPCNFTPIKLFVNSKDSLNNFRWVGIDKQFVSTDKNPSVNKIIKIKCFAAGLNGCSAVDSTNVILDTNKPIFNVINDTIKCVPAFATIKALNITDDRSIVWYDANNKTFKADSVKITSPGKFKLVVEGQNFCKDSVVLTVPIDTIKPIVAIKQLDSFYCANKTISLRGIVNNDSPFEFSWASVNGNFLDKTTLSPVIDKSGRYYFTAIDSFSRCQMKDSIDLTYNAKSSLNFIANVIDPLCLGEKNGSIVIEEVNNNFGNYESQLNEGDFTKNKILYDRIGEGKYRVTVKDSLGCSADSIFNLTGGFFYTIMLPNDTLIDLGKSINLDFITSPSDIDFSSIEWLSGGVDLCNNCKELSLEPTEDVFIKIISKNNDGCTSKDSIKVKVNAIPLIDLPNVISPNSNNENSVFYIPALPPIKEVMLMEIYDSWGNIVHKTVNTLPGDKSSGWDGTFAGKQAIAAVYIVKFKVLLKNGKIKQYVRDLTLVR